MIGSAPIASLCTETTMYMTFTGVLLGILPKEGLRLFMVASSILTGCKRLRAVKNRSCKIIPHQDEIRIGKIWPVRLHA